MHYTQTLAAIALGAVLAVPAAYAQVLKKSDQKIDNADAAAMKQLAQANLNEIEGGKAAAAKAQSADVKEFAQKMASDHQQMLSELETLAFRSLACSHVQSLFGGYRSISYACNVRKFRRVRSRIRRRSRSR